MRLPHYLQGDEMRISQVLINLIKNALKFCPKGDIHVFSSYDNDQRLLRCAVIDNGCGIRAKDMQNLFKQFGKLKRTMHINTEGIGMGLLICKRLIEANNGEIEIHSDGP